MHNIMWLTAVFETKHVQHSWLRPNYTEELPGVAAHDSVCFIASGNSALVYGSAQQLVGAIKQRIVRGYSWQLLGVDWLLTL